MKKLIALVLALVLAFALVACGNGGNAGGDKDKVWKIGVLLPYIGDQSYFDTINAGRLKVEEYDNVETTLIEMGEDKSKWEGYYLDACEGGYDLIVGGNNDAEEYLYSAAEQYPNQLFYNFDYVTHVELPNVYANMYNTPELGYVAGVAASLITTSKMEHANAEKIVGVVVGMDIPAMNDFIGGFCQVCTEYGVQVIIGYPESFADAAKGKEIALNMYNAGADVVWQVAGGAGSGVFEAAAEVGRYAFGVDSDQTISMAGKPELAATIVTSFYKDCGAALVRAVDLLVADKYPSGTETLGIAAKAVGLIKNDQYNKMVPEDIRNQIDDALAKVANGEVEVYSVLKDPDKWESVKAAATAAK